MTDTKQSLNAAGTQLGTRGALTSTQLQIPGTTPGKSDEVYTAKDRALTMIMPGTKPVTLPSLRPTRRQANTTNPLAKFLEEKDASLLDSLNKRVEMVESQWAGGNKLAQIEGYWNLAEIKEQLDDFTKKQEVKSAISGQEYEKFKEALKVGSKHFTGATAQNLGQFAESIRSKRGENTEVEEFGKVWDEMGLRIKEYWGKLSGDEAEVIEKKAQNLITTANNRTKYGTTDQITGKLSATKGEKGKVKWDELSINANQMQFFLSALTENMKDPRIGIYNEMRAGAIKRLADLDKVVPSLETLENTAELFNKETQISEVIAGRITTLETSRTKAEKEIKLLQNGLDENKVNLNKNKASLNKLTTDLSKKVDAEAYGKWQEEIASSIKINDKRYQDGIKEIDNKVEDFIEKQNKKTQQFIEERLALENDKLAIQQQLAASQEKVAASQVELAAAKAQLAAAEYLRQGKAEADTVRLQAESALEQEIKLQEIKLQELQAQIAYKDLELTEKDLKIQREKALYKQEKNRLEQARNDLEQKRAEDLKNLGETVTVLNQKYTEIVDLQSSANEGAGIEVAEFNRQVEALRAQLVAAEENFATKDDLRSAIDDLKVAQDESIEELKASNTELSEELNQIREQANTNLKNQNKEIETLIEGFNKNTEAVAKFNNQVEDFANQVKNSTEAVEAFNTQVKQLNEQAQQNKDSMQVRDGRIDSLTTRLDEISNENVDAKKEADSKLADLAARLDELEGKLKDNAPGGGQGVVINGSTFNINSELKDLLMLRGAAGVEGILQSAMNVTEGKRESEALLGSAANRALSTDTVDRGGSSVVKRPTAAANFRSSVPADLKLENLEFTAMVRDKYQIESAKVSIESQSFISFRGRGDREHFDKMKLDLYAADGEDSKIHHFLTGKNGDQILENLYDQDDDKYNTIFDKLKKDINQNSSCTRGELAAVLKDLVNKKIAEANEIERPYSDNWAALAAVTADDFIKHQESANKGPEAGIHSKSQGASKSAGAVDHDPLVSYFAFAENKGANFETVADNARIDIKIDSGEVERIILEAYKQFGKMKPSIHEARLQQKEEGVANSQTTNEREQSRDEFDNGSFTRTPALQVELPVSSAEITPERSNVAIKQSSGGGVLEEEALLTSGLGSINNGTGIQSQQGFSSAEQQRQSSDVTKPETQSDSIEIQDMDGYFADDSLVREGIKEESNKKAEPVVEVEGASTDGQDSPQVIRDPIGGVEGELEDDDISLDELRSEKIAARNSVEGDDVSLSTIASGNSSLSVNAGNSSSSDVIETSSFTASGTIGNQTVAIEQQQPSSDAPKPEPQSSSIEIQDMGGHLEDDSLVQEGIKGESKKEGTVVEAEISSTAEKAGTQVMDNTMSSEQQVSGGDIEQGAVSDVSDNYEGTGFKDDSLGSLSELDSEKDGIEDLPDLDSSEMSRITTPSSSSEVRETTSQNSISEEELEDDDISLDEPQREQEGARNSVEGDDVSISTIASGNSSLSVNAGNSSSSDVRETTSQNSISEEELEDDDISLDEPQREQEGARNSVEGDDVSNENLSHNANPSDRAPAVVWEDDRNVISEARSSETNIEDQTHSPEPATIKQEVKSSEPLMDNENDRTASKDEEGLNIEDVGPEVGSVSRPKLTIRSASANPNPGKLNPELLATFNNISIPGSVDFPPSARIASSAFNENINDHITLEQDAAKRASKQSGEVMDVFKGLDLNKQFDGQQKQVPKPTPLVPQTGSQGHGI